MDSVKTTQLAREAMLEPAAENRRHGRLFARVIERIARYFYKQVWNRSDVDDLVGQTLLMLQKSLRKGSYDPSRSFNAWMWLKAHTVYLRYLQERGRRPLPLEDRETGVEPAHEARVDARHDARLLLERLQRRLGEETYAIFLLSYDEGLSQVEIAEITGRDRKTVRTRLRKAAAVAREVLEG